MAERLIDFLPGNVPFPADGADHESFSALLSHFQDGEDDLRQILQTEQNNLVINHDIGNSITLSPPEIQRFAHDALNNDELEGAIDNRDIIEILEMGSDSDNLQQYLDTLDISCEECTTYERANKITQIKPGDHIRFHRRYFGVNLYNHHAIVTDVDAIIGDMTLVHFQKRKGRSGVVKEKQKFIRDHDIDIVQYRYRPFTAQQIIDRANAMARKFENSQEAEAYSVPGNNCEDKSNEIATGLKFSSQVAAKVKYVTSTITWLLKLLLKSAVKFCKNIRPYIRGFAHVAVIGGLLTIVDQIISLKNKVKQGLICGKCYNTEYNKLLASLIFCLISVGASLVFHVSWLYFGICTIIGVALPFVTSFLLDSIMPLIQPAANISKPPVLRSSMVRKGDVITFPYVGLNHEGVVTDMSTISTDESDVVKVVLVHFNYPGIFGTRTVVQETFFFNLKSQIVSVYDFTGKNVYPPEEVVNRATTKIGSQNFNTFTNRSSHLCRYCKTGQTDLQTLPEKRVLSIFDMTPGDVINFTYCCLPHDAIVMKVQYPESIRCEVVHYNFPGMLDSRTVVEESFVFNLADQNVFVHDYSGCDVYSPEEVVQRARSRVGEQKFNTFTNRSSHVAKWCKVKK